MPPVSGTPPPSNAADRGREEPSRCLQLRDSGAYGFLMGAHLSPVRLRVESPRGQDVPEGGKRGKRGTLGMRGMRGMREARLRAGGLPW